MAMNRRGFLGRLVAAIVATKAAPSITEAKPWSDIQHQGKRVVGDVYAPQAYQRVLAERDYRVAEWARDSDGRILGVAVEAIPKGQWGLIQVTGPTKIRLTHMLN